jgi:putative nucleotidyltransferase with HDIG domain
VGVDIYARVRRESPHLRVARSLTLLRAFVVSSALILALGAAVLGSLLSSALREQAVDDAERSLAQYTSGVLGSRLVQGSELTIGMPAPSVVRAELAERRDILSVKVWRPDGVLAWTSLEPDRIGRRYPLGEGLTEVIEHGEPEAHLESLDDEEDAAEAGLGVDEVLEVYAPITAGGRVVGAYEVYADARPLEASIADRKRLVWLVTAAVFLVLWGVLVLLARGASETLRRQTRVVRERSLALERAYQQLETNALEAVESLNATVEAKDPYTAGHSLRVQRIALAIADELGLAPRERDDLRLGALFHDIGKIAIPDRILTKPSELTADEYEAIKRHSEEGARIIGKFSRLHGAVPIVNHHHERWDGRGYPDGLAADAIPLAAAIAGLSDAWDAMTTDRPYQGALPWDAAFAEVRGGRGTQFAPAVADAFFAAVKKRPAEFGVDGSYDQLAVG